MQKAFLLSRPDVQSSSQILKRWDDRLNLVQTDKTIWTEITSELERCSELHRHPLIQSTIPDTQQNILHLAVLDDQEHCLRLLSQETELLEGRDCWGLTPLELASYLHKKRSIDILSTKKKPSFFYLEQENVEFVNPERVENLHLELISCPVFANFETLREILSQNQSLKEAGRIPQDRIWLGIYYSREIQSGIHPRVIVRWVDQEIGFGVFAAERILPCSFIGEYTGLVQERQKKHIGASNYGVRYTAWPVGKKITVIDAERMGNFTRHINHSDQPNVALVCAYFRGLPRILLLSLKEIPEGTQLTFDYGETFWKQSPQLTKRFL